MRNLLLGAVVAASLISSGSLRGQEAVPEDSESSRPPDRRMTVLIGVGNTLGWFGGQAETYFSGDRMSGLLGLGYTPEFEPGDGSGMTVAAALRAFTAGSNHRAFAEASISQVGTTSPDGGRYYGPGLQVGYQFVADGWFTLLVSGGAGVALGVPEYVSGSHVNPLLNIGVGYTWR